MTDQPPTAFWDAVRRWAEDSGLFIPPADGVTGPRPVHVPEAVCAACPICQAAATLEQVNPQIVADLAATAGALLDGLGSALTAAAHQRGDVESSAPEGTPDDLSDDPGI